MINTTAAYIRVLVFDGHGGRGGVAMQEFPNFESCQAAITQLEAVDRLRGYCIAKEVWK
jgi:predicted DNA-binding WGR domain protein